MASLASTGSVKGKVDAEASTLSVMDAGFDKLVDALLEKHHIPGMSVALVYNGKTQCKGFGFSELRSTLATPDTLYFAGSTTKAMTAAAAGKIVHSEETGLKDVKWTTPIADILHEDFVLTDQYATSHVTLEDALSHRSGLPAHDASYGRGASSLKECLKSLRHLPFSAELRTSWQYNNMLYAAVGAAVERLTGRELPEILEEWFWKPLGMTSTTMSLHRAQTMNDDAGKARLARGYYWTKDEFYVPDEYPNFNPVAAAGAVISSVRDYSLWIEALLEASSESAAAQAPLSSDLFRDLTTPRSIVPSLYPSLWEHCTGITTCSLGWLVQNLGSRTLISHGGGLVGFGTCVYLLPEEGFGFVSMGNTMGTSNAMGTELFFEVLKRLGLHEPRVMKCSNAADPPEAEAEPDASSKISGPLEDDVLFENTLAYIGSYAHPAYDTVNVAAAESSIIALVKEDTTDEEIGSCAPGSATLHVIPSQGTWPNQYVLRQKSPTSFDMAVYFQRGSECALQNNGYDSPETTRSLACRSVKVLEYLYTGKAVVELDDEGSVRRLGMEMSPELAGSGAAKLDVRAGMIWFDKRS